jgi:hypothetical protein
MSPIMRFDIFNEPAADLERVVAGTHHGDAFGEKQLLIKVCLIDRACR